MHTSNAASTATPEEIEDHVNATMEHVSTVKAFGRVFSEALASALRNHDITKTEEPELSGFARVTPMLTKIEYDSSEYHGCLEQLGGALRHHYLCSPHHPEFHARGIKGMTLVDVVEMFCDWLASARHTVDGNIYRSIVVCKRRFCLSDELEAILTNTAKDIFGNGQPEAEDTTSLDTLADLYMQLPYRYALEPNPEEEGGGYRAFVYEFGKESVVGYGDAPEEAFRHLRSVLWEHIRQYLEEDVPFPPPEGIYREIAHSCN